MLDPGHLFSRYNKHLAKDIAIAEMTYYLNSVITGVFSTLTGGKRKSKAAQPNKHSPQKKY